MEAGNTVETLQAVDVIDAAPAPVVIPEAASVLDTVNAVNAVADEAVSREEFNELQDAFLRLVARIQTYNLGAPHKI